MVDQSVLLLRINIDGNVEHKTTEAIQSWGENISKNSFTLFYPEL